MRIQFTYLKNIFIILLISIAGTLAAQDCSSAPTSAQLNVLTNLESDYNLRLNRLEELSLPQLYQIKEIQQINGNIDLITGLENLPPNALGELTDQRRNVPIVAHVIRRDNGSGGISQSDLEASVDRAKAFYSSLNFYLFLCDINYIDDTDLYDEYLENDGTEAGIINVSSQNVDNKLNIYFVSNSETSWANFPDTDANEQHIIMNNSHARNESTLAHEIGHWFNLLHTHETSAGVELVNGNNCDDAGDLCCDTPADPNISGDVDSSCNYTGTNTDSNNQSYSPDPKNTMSYTRKKCRELFSEEQIYRMHAAYLGMESDRGYSFTSCNEIRRDVSRFGEALAVGDFNNDGYDDLAIGAPNSNNNQGLVYVYKGGSPNRLNFWFILDQSDLGGNENGDLFGFSLAAGDFNGDGKDDLAIVAPGESPGSSPKSGYVFTFKGSNDGLLAWRGLDQEDELGNNEAGDLFGHSLAVGDFNGDGKDDLAVGAPGESPGSNPKSGDVFTFKGSRSGLSAWKGFGGQRELGSNEDGDLTGWALAAGDFNGDGKDDLAVGCPGESPGSSPQSGDVLTYKGTRNGLSPWKGFGGQKGLGKNENGDQFGYALSVGDYNGDGKDDLAVGSPGESPGSSPKSGDVMTYKGSNKGLLVWKGFNGQTGIGANEHGDQFGWSLASGDFDKDGKDDLAVGGPGESPGSSPKSGYVFTYKGKSSGLSPWKGIDQKDNGLQAKNEANDQFGYSLASGDFNGDGLYDLAIGIPGEKPGNLPRTGYVFIHIGTSSQTGIHSNALKGIGP